MNFMTLLLLLCTASALAALSWWGCAWWYGRKLADLHRRLEKTRATAAQTATANRNQISQLQRELAERTTLSKTQREARRTSHVHAWHLRQLVPITPRARAQTPLPR